MCDYSLQLTRSRPAAVGDKLTTYDFGTGTQGFTDITDPGIAVCVLPGTEIAFDAPIEILLVGPAGWKPITEKFNVGIFRQVNKDRTAAHHDALELPNGRTILLTFLTEGQRATVLQLPAVPKTKEEAEEQTRVEYVG